MKNDLWVAVYDVFRKLDELFGRDRAAAVSADSSPASQDSAGQTAPGADEDLPLPLDELLHARSELRRELDVVRAKLADRLNERDTYLVLFAIVAHFDELIQMRFLRGDKLSWPTLQRELFQVDDAGEIFYDTLDDILMKVQTLPFVLEVYYFCLNDGFMGKYDRNPSKIREYMQRLRQRIPVQEMEIRRREELQPIVIHTPTPPAAYYLGAVVALLAFYWVLMVAAWIWDPLTDL